MRADLDAIRARAILRDGGLPTDTRLDLWRQLLAKGTREHNALQLKRERALQGQGWFVRRIA